MLLWTKLDFTVHLTFAFFGHFMIEFTAYRVIRTFFLIVVIMTILNMRILVYIHVLFQSTVWKESFITHITFFVFSSKTILSLNPIWHGPCKVRSCTGGASMHVDFWENLEFFPKIPKTSKTQSLFVLLISSFLQTS